MWKFALFLLFEAAEFMYVNIDRQIVANLRTILYKECNKCDVGPTVVAFEMNSFKVYQLITPACP